MVNSRFKFRAWEKTSKEMVYDVQNVSRKRIIGESACESFHDVLSSWEYVVMQFTGLYDKNGKEIYEGDIVESLTKINGYVCRGVVIFENGKFMVDVKKAAFARDGFISDFDLKIREYEVIGNIYEHKHLLEGTE